MKVGERRTERARRGGRKATAQPPARYAVRCRGLRTAWRDKRTKDVQPQPARGLLTPSLPRSHGMQADRLQLCQKSSLICAHDETPTQVEALSVVCVLVVV